MIVRRKPSRHFGSQTLQLGPCSTHSLRRSFAQLQRGGQRLMTRHSLFVRFAVENYRSTSRMISGSKASGVQLVIVGICAAVTSGLQLLAGQLVCRPNTPMLFWASRSRTG